MKLSPLHGAMAQLAVLPTAVLALSVKHGERVYVQVNPSQGLALSEKRIIEGLVDRARRACNDLKRAWVIAEAEGPFSLKPNPETLTVKALLVAYGLDAERIKGGNQRVAVGSMKSTAETTLVRVELTCDANA
ncbi:hypothetical protein [Roseateles asaccharophilus]|uniref:Uncharacterized protein n=1 Tax=Roseateles asaccharophilus TaxID=582607 RepID=A0ABU2A338_9BURK|nr:hypothetical protein [Roseateles asaccharophilus]MDR7331601.1 hypothetical protein [Roseateles asaccharophilus]